MANAEVTLARKEEAAKEEIEAHERRRVRAQMEQEASTFSTSHVELESSTSTPTFSSDLSEVANVEKERAIDNEANFLKRKRVQNIMTPGLVAALDCSKTTDRMAPYILAETANSLIHNPAELNISHSSIKWYREQYREQKWKELKESAHGTQCVKPLGWKTLAISLRLNRNS